LITFVSGGKDVGLTDLDFFEFVIAEGVGQSRPRCAVCAGQINLRLEYCGAARRYNSSADRNRGGCHGRRGRRNSEVFPDASEAVAVIGSFAVKPSVPKLPRLTLFTCGEPLL